jgi:hypothetical protein
VSNVVADLVYERAPFTMKKREAYSLTLYVESIGGAEGIRTPDLANASRALCQLSYSPTVWKSNGTRQHLALSSRPYGSKDRQRFAVIDFQEFICYYVTVVQQIECCC